MLSELALHPDDSRGPVNWVRVATRRREDGRLSLTYLVSCETDQVQLPPPKEAERTDQLWRRTCFEAFLAGSGVDSYNEFNFSPSGQWAAYRFDGYRTGMAPLEIDAPSITTRIGPDRIVVHATISPIADRGADLRLGLTAIIEDVSGCRTHWALMHLPGKPDFHRVETFSLKLSAVCRLEDR